jgi:competence ComEA-like helix-hairpin-helix protein
MDSDSTEAEDTPVQAAEEAPESAPETFEKVDLNTASMDELAELPGIGDLLAQNIVAHREAYGEFSNLDDLSRVAGIGPSTIDDLRGQVEIKAQPDITDWLKSVDVESTGEDVVEPASEPTEAAPADDLPSWLADLDTDSEQAQPAGAGEDDLPAWLREEAEGESARPEPTDPSEWRPADAAESAPEPEATAEESAPEPEVEEQPAQGAPPPKSESEVEETPLQSVPPAAPEPEPKEESEAPSGTPAYQEPVTRSRTGMTGMLSPAQDPALTAAQNELTRGNIPGAMENYGKLIKKGKMLEEIIFDLREALYRYPVEVNILQTLGDAYMRANRLQEALDAYTKAEELLR